MPTQDRFDEIFLETEHIQLLVALVEAYRSQPRSDNPYFMSWLGGYDIYHQALPGERRVAFTREIDTLEAQGLIQIREGPRHDTFFITPLGFSYYDFLKSQNEIGTYLSQQADMDFDKVLLGNEQKSLLCRLSELANQNGGDRANEFLFSDTFASTEIRHSNADASISTNRTDVEVRPILRAV